MKIIWKNAYVEKQKYGIHVYGNSKDIAQMMGACVLALENNGYDMNGVKDVISKVTLPAKVGGYEHA